MLLFLCKHFSLFSDSVSFCQNLVSFHEDQSHVSFCFISFHESLISSHEDQSHVSFCSIPFRQGGIPSRSHARMGWAQYGIFRSQQSAYKVHFSMWNLAWERLWRSKDSKFTPSVKEWDKYDSRHSEHEIQHWTCCYKDDCVTVVSLTAMYARTDT